MISLKKRSLKMSDDQKVELIEHCKVICDQRREQVKQHFDPFYSEEHENMGGKFITN